jgi:CsoR family transcriptional regulator, copper-sensing transcriptional repressor
VTPRLDRRVRRTEALDKNTLEGYGIAADLETRGGTVRGYAMNKDDYLRRLRRIEGQVRGLQRLVSEDAYCIDVLTQVAAATRALQGVAVGLLDEHVRHCVANAAGDEDPKEAEEMITEAMRAIERLIRS